MELVRDWRQHVKVTQVLICAQIFWNQTMRLASRGGALCSHALGMANLQAVGMLHARPGSASRHTYAPTSRQPAEPTSPFR